MSDSPFESAALQDLIAAACRAGRDVIVAGPETPGTTTLIRPLTSADDPGGDRA